MSNSALTPTANDTYLVSGSITFADDDDVVTGFQVEVPVIGKTYSFPADKPYVSSVRGPHLVHGERRSAARRRRADELHRDAREQERRGERGEPAIDGPSMSARDAALARDAPGAASAVAARHASSRVRRARRSAPQLPPPPPPSTPPQYMPPPSPPPVAPGTPPPPPRRDKEREPPSRRERERDKEREKERDREREREAAARPRYVVAPPPRRWSRATSRRPREPLPPARAALRDLHPRGEHQRRRRRLDVERLRPPGPAPPRGRREGPPDDLPRRLRRPLVRRDVVRVRRRAGVHGRLVARLQLDRLAHRARGAGSLPPRGARRPVAGVRARLRVGERVRFGRGDAAGGRELHRARAGALLGRGGLPPLAALRDRPVRRARLRQLLARARAGGDERPRWTRASRTRRSTSGSRSACAESSSLRRARAR